MPATKAYKGSKARGSSEATARACKDSKSQGSSGTAARACKDSKSQGSSGAAARTRKDSKAQGSWGHRGSGFGAKEAPEQEVNCYLFCTVCAGTTGFSLGIYVGNWSVAKTPWELSPDPIDETAPWTCSNWSISGRLTKCRTIDEWGGVVAADLSIGEIDQWGATEQVRYYIHSIISATALSRWAPGYTQLNSGL
jgi:hypothetical protein